jgi:ABC-type glycerol-3-phosphate transport system substrate-binding protein
MKSKRIWTLTLVVVLVLTLLGSCGRPGVENTDSVSTPAPTGAPVPEDTPETAPAQEPTVIKLGLIGSNPYIMNAVGEYYKENNAVRIEIVDYSIYNESPLDAEGGLMKFEQDIRSGNAPDLLGLGSFSSFPTEQYANKGLLADMTELLDNDSLIDRSDLFESVIEAGTYDGKLYQILPVFTVSSLVGKTSVFGDGDISTAEIVEIAARYPGAEIVADMSGYEWIDVGVGSMMSALVNWENGTCDFNNEEFIALLESAKLLPKEISNEIKRDRLTLDMSTEYYDEAKEKFRDDKALLVYTYVSLPRIARNMRETFGEDVTFLGMPPTNGANVVNRAYYGDFSIMESSEHKDEAWAFISFLMRQNGEMLRSLGIIPGISIIKSDFIASLADEMTPPSERDFSEGVWLQLAAGSLFRSDKIDSPDAINASEYENYRLTEYEAERAIDLIENATVLRTGAGAVMDIVLKEAEPFLADTISTAEAALAIQGAVTAYLSENA